MEWLETDGKGGFAMGNASGIPGRRYHSLLTAASGSPANRFNLVNSLHVEFRSSGGTQILSAYQFHPGGVSSEGVSAIRAFSYRPWPTWTYEVGPAMEILQEIVICRTENGPSTVVRWSVLRGDVRGVLSVRPLISGRDYHALHHRNDSFNFECSSIGGCMQIQPYPALPQLSFLSNGNFSAAPHWFENIWYNVDKERGADYLEDLAVPGSFEFQIAEGPAVLVMHPARLDNNFDSSAVEKHAAEIISNERKRRSGFSSALALAGDSYIVDRDSGKTIIAGYPWFADWGRDTFISMRGLCLSTGRVEDAENILLQWSAALSEGMMPNRFLEHGEQPEYNSVDAALWFVIAAYEFLSRCSKTCKPDVRSKITTAINAIITKFIAGTRFGIACDPHDGLLRAGQNGMQLTWMDAKIGDYVVTPRIGKPVEIQALWINALAIASSLLNRHAALLALAKSSFAAKFWNESRQCLYDVCDADHMPGKNDDSLRPNQIFAVGGLPHMILPLERAVKVVELVRNSLWTPYGLRSLAPSEPGYRERYCGNGFERDTAYHQGTVWPWLNGAFVEAWVRVKGSSAERKAEAREAFLKPMLRGLEEAGMGHLSEIHDANAPFLHRGCPFQAWSVGEALRLELDVLAL